jgi:hypothetical protein
MRLRADEVDKHQEAPDTDGRYDAAELTTRTMRAAVMGVDAMKRT